MNSTVKRIISVVVGLATAFIITFGFEFLCSFIYKAPCEDDMKDPIKMKLFMESMPVGAYLLVLLGYTIGSFFGGMVASIISGKENGRATFLVGFIFMVMGILFIISMPGQPLWFIILNIAVYIPFAYFGHLAVRRKK